MTMTALFSRKQSGGVYTVQDIREHPGQIFFVDSGHADAEDSVGAGKNPDKPLATIDYAIGLCTANNGDVIYVMPGHTETISGAAGIDLDVAGVSIIGLGRGVDRPTITHSAVASTLHMDAPSCRISNLLFTPSAAATIIVDIDKTDCQVDNCEFRMGTAVTAIDINGGGANACDRARILDNIIDASTDGPDCGIGLDAVADSVIIDGNWIYGLFDDAGIHNPTSAICTWLRITNNFVVNTTAASHSIELVSACTGILAGNLCGSPLADATPTDIDGGGMHILENYSHDAGGNDSGLLNPVADS